ncbi:acetylornithine transaminase [Thermodesulfovibrionales bacterium]|nr:acetylornithine transaminase [Thermodesulfovibrionales bacterium]
MKGRAIIEESDRYLMRTYDRFPIVLKKGRGIKVWDVDGKEYLDFTGGIAVNIVGHCHPNVVRAIQRQAEQLLHVSNLYHIEPQTSLARLLCTNSFAEKAFFCNSGAEANEAAIKLARKYAKECYGADRFEIITALNSFHGRTLAAVTSTGQEKFQKGFEPLMPGFRYVPFGDADAIESAITKNTSAVMLEPIQGEGGIIIPGEDYLKKVREICDKHKLLLILDEVQTGIGRTGRLFAYEHYGITPDIMTLAKGLGGGAPIGAMLTTEEVSSAFRPGNHASTFGGNPLVSAAAIATLETVLGDGILDHCNKMGTYIIKRLAQIRDYYPEQVVDIRGKGLFTALEINRDGMPVVKRCIERGALINCTAGNILRFMPPLTVEEGDIDHLVSVLKRVMG